MRTVLRKYPFLSTRTVSVMSLGAMSESPPLLQKPSFDTATLRLLAACNNLKTNDAQPTIIAFLFFQIHIHIFDFRLRIFDF